MKTYQAQPCAECPWRSDVPPRRFAPERFIALAATAYDTSPIQFACHKSPETAPVGCAGFVLRGAAHNLGARLAASFGRLDHAAVSDGGRPLYADYRAMAIANGVPADHPALRPCRSERP